MNYLFLLCISFISMISFSQNLSLSESEKMVTKVISDTIKFKKLLAIRLYSNKAFNSSEIEEIINKSDFNGLISVLTLNFDEGIRILKKQDLVNTNYNIENLFKIAKENTIRINKNNKFEKVPIHEDLDFYVVEDLNNLFVNSTIFDKEKLMKFSRKYGVVFATPTRGTVLLMPIREKDKFSKDIRVFYDVVSQMYLNESNPTSNAVFMLFKNEYYPIAPILKNGTAINFSVPNIW